jgi:hypothetical protein
MMWVTVLVCLISGVLLAWALARTITYLLHRSRRWPMRTVEAAAGPRSSLCAPSARRGPSLQANANRPVAASTPW